MAPDGVLNGQSPISDDFDPSVFFDGNLRATGMFIDRFGVVKRRFTVSAKGIAGSSGITLYETFTYDDGEVEDRIWHISKRTEIVLMGRRTIWRAIALVPYAALFLAGHTIST